MCYVFLFNAYFMDVVLDLEQYYVVSTWFFAQRCNPAYYVYAARGYFKCAKRVMASSFKLCISNLSLSNDFRSFFLFFFIALKIVYATDEWR